jgi:diguanylate cyclase (GGDEF)-like protein
MTDAEGTVDSSEVAEQEVERQILAESLGYLYRSMPSAVMGHVVASSLIVASLYDVINHTKLVIWLGAVFAVGALRFLVTRRVEREQIDSDEITVIRRRANILATLAFVQASIWGCSVFYIWPVDVAHRAVLITILAGIIAASGIMLLLHRNAFLIYSLPIVIPAVVQLVISGDELEWILAALLVFYLGLLFASVTRLTNVFIEGLRVRFTMQAESRTDALTGLTNRRGFDESLHDIWQQSIRSGQSIGLLMIDVDFFKHYNDYYGHPRGDMALKKVSAALSKVASRSTDLCARIGGEEFAILLPTTELKGALQVARAIQEELAVANIPHRNSERGVLTVSIGVNVIQATQQSTMNHFTLEADQALYEAKESGRNQICIAKSVQKRSDEASESEAT